MLWTQTNIEMVTQTSVLRGFSLPDRERFENARVTERGRASASGELNSASTQIPDRIIPMAGQDGGCPWPGRRISCLPTTVTGRSATHASAAADALISLVSCPAGICPSRKIFTGIQSDSVVLYKRFFSIGEELIKYKQKTKIKYF